MLPVSCDAPLVPTGSFAFVRTKSLRPSPLMRHPVSVTAWLSVLAAVPAAGVVAVDVCRLALLSHATSVSAAVHAQASVADLKSFDFMQSSTYFVVVEGSAARHVPDTE